MGCHFHVRAATSVPLDNHYAQAYADRGMLNDRAGQYEAALADY
jgi:hypothetical protein